MHHVAQAGLADADGEITASLLDDAAHGVGGAAQIAGDRVGIIQRDEQAVYLVHVGEDLLAALQVALAHAIEHIAS